MTDAVILRRSRGHGGVLGGQGEQCVQAGIQGARDCVDRDACCVKGGQEEAVREGAEVFADGGRVVVERNPSG